VGTLYVVATPIGNLEDVTLRALRVLREAGLLLAEDTRRTRVLLERHAIPARPRSLHAHNEAARLEEALAALAAGRRVALVSDAGTPLVSDPGGRLVTRALAAGHEVVPVPGPSAALAALVASGLSAEAFTFVGFLPRKAGERAARLAALAERPETLILFESPRRLPATLGELARAFGGERRACVARELTKLHEESARGSLSELARRFADRARGEVTLVIEGAPSTRGTPAARELRERVRAGLAAGASARDVAAELARETGVAKRAIYAIAVEESGG
jgi:16S rRNA (cytidine1402-2'-O)-methyltransferase